MKLLRYVARPTSKAGESDDIEGAYVNCWVSTRSSAEAMTIARKNIRSAGWLIEALEEIKEVEREDFKGKPRSLASYDVAVRMKWSLTIHMWRRNGQGKQKTKRGGAVKRRARPTAGK